MNPEQQAAEVEQKEAQEQQRQDMLRNLLQPSARDRRALAGPSLKYKLVYTFFPEGIRWNTHPERFQLHFRV